MSDKVTTQIIIDTMKSWVEDKEPISPAKYVEAAAKLNVLIGDENDLLYSLEHFLAIKKRDLLSEENMTVAKANSYIEALDEYKEYRIQGARIKQIQEFIRIAKKQATITSEEYKGY
ncbi:MAG: hypothetical protein ACTSQE_14900 [Candidatus Heimdallarchaeaceae archaeon]